MKNSPRYLSILILSQNQQKKEPVDAVMDRLLAQADLSDSRDSHLVMTIVYGVLRRRSYLDAVLSRFCRRPLSRLKNFTLQALRVGVFQLLFLDRIPDSAAVNETVKAMKEARQPGALISFVNGVLRALSRQGYRPDLWGEDSWPAPVKLSHPDWLYQRYQKRYGREKAQEICAANNRQPCLTLSLNPSAPVRDEFLEILARQNIRAIPGQYIPEAVILPELPGRVHELPGYNQGWFMVQDEGAQLITRMLGPFQSGSYLDACAGVGGKTVQLYHLMPQAGSLTALEPNRRRFNLLKENLQRMNLAGSVTLFNMDLREFRGQSGTTYDSILLDAPCSGLGVIRRHPDIRWHLKQGAGDLKYYQKIQTALLKEAAGLVTAGGTLVYATCSTEPEENEEVIEEFLTSHPQFKPDLPQLPRGCAGLLDEKGFLRLAPAEYHDGFFAARLVMVRGQRSEDRDRKSVSRGR